MRVARVLARGERERRAASDVDSGDARVVRLKPLRRRGECQRGAMTSALTLAAHWLRADPVHLRADPTRVILFDADSVGLDDAESDALLAHLNAGFPGGELHFERAAAPTRWYVRMTMPVALALASPRALRGTDGRGQPRRTASRRRLESPHDRSADAAALKRRSISKRARAHRPPTHQQRVVLGRRYGADIKIRDASSHGAGRRRLARRLRAPRGH